MRKNRDKGDWQLRWIARSVTQKHIDRYGKQEEDSSKIRTGRTLTSMQPQPKLSVIVVCQHIFGCSLLIGYEMPVVLLFLVIRVDAGWMPKVATWLAGCVGGWFGGEI